MVARTLILFSALMSMWLLMSGYYTALITGLGVVSVFFATLMATRVNAQDSEGLPLHMMARLPGYLLWLFREIAVSNIVTIKLILFRPPEPVVFRTRYTQKTPAGVATYANSITLTPGTVTVDIDDRGFLVHALSPELGEGIKDGEMDRRVTRVEGDAS